MSHKHFCRGSPDDCRSHQDVYSDAYQSDSDIYSQRGRSASQESERSASYRRAIDSVIPVPRKSLSFLQSSGLDVSDLSQLDGLYGHLHSDLDRYGNPRKCGSGNGRKTSNILDGNRFSDGDPWHDELPFTSTASSSVLQSYDKCSRGPRQCSESLHQMYPLFKVPTRKEASDFHGITPPVFPHACVLCNVTVLTEKVWLWHIRGARHDHNRHELLKKYSEWDQNIESAKRNEGQTSLKPTFKTRDPTHKVPTRKEASDFRGRVPPVFPYECFLCDVPVFSTEDWLVHIESTLHAKNQLDLIEKYPEWDQTVESSRRNEWHGTSEARIFERRDPLYKVPTRKEASDFHGKVPPVFPYACVLCDITVLSENDWLVHTRGAQHANSQLALVEKYPEWDHRIQSSRRNECQVIPQAMSTKPRGGIQQESKKNTANSENKSTVKTTVKEHGRVVCIKFAPSSLEEGYLKKLLWKFGTIVKVSMFFTQALVEMESKYQSEVIVKHFNDNPLEVEGKQVEFSISATSTFQSSHVVTFTPVPAGEGTTSELMAIAKRFGTVKNSLFLPTRGYVEMTDSADAKKLVEHFSSKPLKLKKKNIQVTFSSEFETLMASLVENAQSLISSPWSRSSSERSSSERDSPSPKRRCSRERTSPKEQDRHHSRERPKTVTRKTSVSPHASVKDEDKMSCADSEIKIGVNCDHTDNMDSDSDLEGLEVIAEDEEELRDDDDDGGDDNEATGDQKMDKEQKTCEELAQLDGQISSSSGITTNQKPASAEEDVTCSSSQSLENSSSDREDITVFHSETQVKNIDQAAKKPQIKEQQDEVLKMEEVDIDFPETLENCITLDEVVEESYSDYEASIEQNSSALKTEIIMEDVNETTQLPVSSSYTDSEENKKISDSSTEEGSKCTAVEVKSSVEVSMKYTTDRCIEKQDFEKDTNRNTDVFGKVLEVRNLPKTEDFTDLDFMNIAKRYGEVKHCLLFRCHKRGFIEMMHTSDAERIAVDSKNQDIALRGNILEIKLSEKYSSLTTVGFSLDSDDQESDKRAISGVSTDSQSAAVDKRTTESSNEPQEPDAPLGTEFVCPVLGFICKLCNAIYATEEEAKDKHCRSSSHHQKLKEHKEKMPRHEDHST